MAKGVIDLLEVVDVQKNEAEICLDPAQPFPREQVDGDLEHVIIVTPVVQSGQLVDHGERHQFCVDLRDLFLCFHQLGDVMGDAPRADDLPVAVVQGILAGGKGDDLAACIDGLLDAVDHGDPGFHDTDFIPAAYVREYLRIEISVALADQIFLVPHAKLTDVHPVVQDEPGLSVLEIDRILDKIRKSGYDSLTAKEKQELFDESDHK